MQTTDFYKNIQPFSDFGKVTEPRFYHPAPADWLVIAADIIGSTKAVQAGLYKEVNVTGASAIMAVLNAVGGRTDIPYVFGGDGASFVIPPELKDAVVTALIGTQEMAKIAFGLTLRIGLVPLAEIRRAGRDVLLARYKMSDNITIAMFDGGGLDYAESLIKDAQTGPHFDIARHHDPSLPVTADFSGLECRWNPLQARSGSTISMLVQAQGHDRANTYARLLAAIQDIYGAADNYRPARKDNLSLTFRPRYLRQEFGVQTSKAGIRRRLRYFCKLAFEAVLGSALFKFNLRAGNVEGRQYIADLVDNTDFQKFDDMLRMVIDSAPHQTAALEHFLGKEHVKGNLFYGLHRADSALLTCLIFSHHKNHVHFIDGSSGGYALAALKMKEQKKTARQGEETKNAATG